MPDISTNISYLGVRGFQRIPSQTFNFVYQFEAGIDISAAPGTKQSNSNFSNQVNGALVQPQQLHRIRLDRTGAPSRSARATRPTRTRPRRSIRSPACGATTASSWATRAATIASSSAPASTHAIWYESPTFGGGFKFKCLFSPGQNRADDSGNLASGEGDCAGNNDPNSGANPLANCSDGAFSNAVSADLSYKNGPFYATAAYEFHQNVNRSSDIAGAYAGGPFAPAAPFTCNDITSPLGQQLCNNDTANEDAMKIGLMYTFPTKTTVGVIGERLHRYVSADLDFQNERSRYGTWLVVSQEMSPVDSLHFGWAHAFRSPGNPGQHNDSTRRDLPTAPHSAVRPKTRRTC